MSNLNPFHPGFWTPHHPIDHLTAPTRNRPSWYVPMLVFQGGTPNLSRSSWAGGGFLPMKTLRGRETPGWQPYAQPLASQVGGGMVPTRPNFLTALLGGRSVQSLLP